MKINCICGYELEVLIQEHFPINGEKYDIRRQCTTCKRSYEITVKLVVEKEEWGKF